MKYFEKSEMFNLINFNRKMSSEIFQIQRPPTIAMMMTYRRRKR